MAAAAVLPQCPSNRMLQTGGDCITRTGTTTSCRCTGMRLCNWTCSDYVSTVVLLLCGSSGLMHCSHCSRHTGGPNSCRHRSGPHTHGSDADAISDSVALLAGTIPCGLTLGSCQGHGHTCGDAGPQVHMHWPELANRPLSWCNALCTSRAHGPKVFNTITGVRGGRLNQKADSRTWRGMHACSSIRTFTSASDVTLVRTAVHSGWFTCTSVSTLSACSAAAGMP